MLPRFTAALLEGAWRPRIDGFRRRFGSAPPFLTVFEKIRSACSNRFLFVRSSEGRIVTYNVQRSVAPARLAIIARAFCMSGRRQAFPEVFLRAIACFMPRNGRHPDGARAQ
jgi:hypothetical protein